MYLQDKHSPTTQAVTVNTVALDADSDHEIEFHNQSASGMAYLLINGLLIAEVIFSSAFDFNYSEAEYEDGYLFANEHYEINNASVKNVKVVDCYTLEDDDKKVKIDVDDKAMGRITDCLETLISNQDDEYAKYSSEDT